MKDLSFKIEFRIGPGWERYLKHKGRPQTGNNDRTISISNLLRVTSSLSSFELSVANNFNAEEPHMPASMDCLLGLQSSFSSLTSIRLTDLDVRPPNQSLTFDYWMLTSLTHLSMNGEL